MLSRVKRSMQDIHWDEALNGFIEMYSSLIEGEISRSFRIAQSMSAFWGYSQKARYFARGADFQRPPSAFWAVILTNKAFGFKGKILFKQRQNAFGCGSNLGSKIPKFDTSVDWKKDQNFFYWVRENLIFFVHFFHFSLKMQFTENSQKWPKMGQKRLFLGIFRCFWA